MTDDIDEYKSSENMKKFWHQLSMLKAYIMTEYAKKPKDKVLKKIYEDLHRIYKTTTEEELDV